MMGKVSFWGACRSCFMCLTPHSMGTERAVSHYNQLKSSHRLTMKTDTVPSRMMVSMNGVGVSCFEDPRPAVAHILRKKAWRGGTPSPEVYSKQDFVQGFFRSGGVLSPDCEVIKGVLLMHLI